MNRKTQDALDSNAWQRHWPSTDTLRYPFGETPEEVIRKQFGENEMHHFYAPRMEGPYGGEISFSLADDLIAVLDALKFHRNHGAAGPHAHDLRISILAALGINEGGE